jgi:hypothetical protein
MQNLRSYIPYFPIIGVTTILNLISLILLITFIYRLSLERDIEEDYLELQRQERLKYSDDLSSLFLPD